MKDLNWKDFGIDKDEERRIRAELKFAVNSGLIENDSLEDLERRRMAKNNDVKTRLLNNEIVYGLTSYPPHTYIRQELTGFRLDFISELPQIKYDYEAISEEDMKSFYEDNPDLFTRAAGDFFSYDEVKLIIRKKMRELEYERNVDLLCEQL